MFTNFMEEIYRGSSLFNVQPNNFDNQNFIMYKARGSPVRSGIAGRIPIIKDQLKSYKIY